MRSRRPPSFKQAHRFSPFRAWWAEVQPFIISFSFSFLFFFWSAAPLRRFSCLCACLAPPSNAKLLTGSLRLMLHLSAPCRSEAGWLGLPCPRRCCLASALGCSNTTIIHISASIQLTLHCTHPSSTSVRLTASRRAAFGFGFGIAIAFGTEARQSRIRAATLLQPRRKLLLDAMHTRRR